MRIPLTLVLCLLLASCGAVAQVSIPGGEEGGKTSLQLIEEARQRGEIDEDRATLYGVYAVKDGERLPSRYRGTAPVKDGTSVLRAAQARFASLRPENQELLRPYLFSKGDR